MKKTVVNAAVKAAIFASLLVNQVNATQVKVLDKTHFPASNFLAYTEFELSGEPLAEALGLDLDILDPNAANIPTAFDFSAGIESYEYSEEAMYALNYQSTMGVHLANGPLNKRRGGTLASLKTHINELAKAVGLNNSEIAVNMYPLSLPYVSGSPEFKQKPDTRTSPGETLEITTAQGEDKTVNTVQPVYAHDYQTLAWDNSSFDKSFNPAAIGAIFLKEVMWSQDFLGGMHITATDEEVPAENAQMDQDGKHSLGVSAADGFNGMMLTEMSIDKLLILQQQLGFNGSKLGVTFDPGYNPKNNPEDGAVWFANKLSVSETHVNGVNAIKALKVTNGTSTLRDTWQMLWPVAEFFAYSDQRIANSGLNPATLAVFDGTPFTAAPTVNTDNNDTNDIIADDAFSLAKNISNLLFKNIFALHFNQQHGSFVTEYKIDEDKVAEDKIAETNKPQQGNKVTAYDAAYSIVALSIFQRAKDALPVGYASADSGAVNLKTPDGKQALMMIKAQADFINQHLITANGLVADGLTLAKESKNPQHILDTNSSLETQFATIRGLVAAFLATEDVKYKQAARNIYLAVEKHMFDNKINTWASTPGKATLHTPYTEAAISGGLRETILHLKNEEGEHAPALEVQALTDRYVSWFSTVINGAMQLAEPLGDTGENQLAGSKSTDIDEDGVHQIIGAGGKFGTATTMANKVSIQ